MSTLAWSPSFGTSLVADDQPSTVTVRLDSDLVRKARFVCARRKGRGGSSLKLVDYLDSLVRSLIENDYNAEVDGTVQEAASRPQAQPKAEESSRRKKKGE